MANTGFDINNVGSTLVNNALSNVAGILSTRPNAKYMSGARCTLKINGTLVGFAFGISWNINTTYVENNTIDDYLSFELIPTRISVDGSISALHIPGSSAGTLNWQPNVLSFLFAPYISIEARDSATNQIIFATDKAVIVTRSEEIRVDTLSNVTLRWRAIGYVDEQTPVSPNDYNQSSTTATPATQGNLVTNAIASVSNAINNLP
jgi:hypothetical protein